MSLVPEEAGPDRCLEGTVTDITERKRSETELRDTQALRSVSSLGRAAAHEINNALTPLVGHLQLLDRQMAEVPGARRRLAAAMKAAERIHETVARMARITRVELANGLGDLHEMLDLARSAGDPEQPANGRDRRDGAGGA
jgi:nitrogen-specific signal transduction histidine kinase